ncbi:MAG: UDP-N-acetylmuramate dehydrogenase, partial [Rhodoferax sp.]
MVVEKNVALQSLNSFHIVAKAHALVRIGSVDDVRAVLASGEWAAAPKLVLGGGSNLVLTGDVRALVLKVEIGT